MCRGSSCCHQTSVHIYIYAYIYTYIHVQGIKLLPSDVRKRFMVVMVGDPEANSHIKTLNLKVAFFYLLSMLMLIYMRCVKVGDREANSYIQTLSTKVACACVCMHINMRIHGHVMYMRIFLHVMYKRIYVYAYICLFVFIQK